ncbi:MAG: Flp pilus assembly protein CpaB [Gemmatimonadota bacterium]
MTKRFGLVFSLALASGAAAAWLAWTFLRDTGPTEVLGAVPATEVVLAARDLAPGEVIEAQDIKLVSWPQGDAPAGYALSPAEVVGRGVIVSIRANEPLMSTKLANREAGSGLAITIPAGKRAMSVKVDDVIAVSGWATPGTRVDVVATLDQAAQVEEPRTQLVLQNIEVLAAGQTTERDFRGEPKSVPVVTLLVDPSEAEKLTLATTKGRIQLVLRNPLDLELAETEGTSTGTLLPSSKRPTRAPVRRASAPAAAPRPAIELFRGPEKSSSVIPGGSN